MTRPVLNTSTDALCMCSNSVVITLYSNSANDVYIAVRLASQVLLATLAIPIVPVSTESTRFLQHDSYVHEKDRRLASLLRLKNIIPTRHSLHKDLVSVHDQVVIDDYNYGVEYITRCGWEYYNMFLMSCTNYTS